MRESSLTLGRTTVLAEEPGQHAGGSVNSEVKVERSMAASWENTIFQPTTRGCYKALTEFNRCERVFPLGKVECVFQRYWVTVKGVLSNCWFMKAGKIHILKGRCICLKIHVYFAFGFRSRTASFLVVLCVLGFILTSSASKRNFPTCLCLVCRQPFMHEKTLNLILLLANLSQFSWLLCTSHL